LRLDGIVVDVIQASKPKLANGKDPLSERKIFWRIRVLSDASSRLRKIYQREVDIDCREITALDRFSNRI